MTKEKQTVRPKILLGMGATLLLLLLTLVVYQVDTTEFAIVTQFGNPIRVVESPGLRVKLPDPMIAWLPKTAQGLPSLNRGQAFALSYGF